MIIFIFFNVIIFEKQLLITYSFFKFQSICLIKRVLILVCLNMLSYLPEATIFFRNK